MATATIAFPVADDAPDAEDDSKTMTSNDPVSDSVIEPNDSDPEGNDLTVSTANGSPIDSDGLSTITAIWGSGDHQSTITAIWGSGDHQC